MPLTSTDSKPKPSKRRYKAAAAATKPKLSHAEQMRLGSAQLVAELNAKMARDDRRRAAAGKEPLMHFVLPEDLFSRPRMFGYEIDEDEWEGYSRKYRRDKGEPSDDERTEIDSGAHLTFTFALLRRRSGIKYVQIEWCLPEEYSEETAREAIRRPCTSSAASASTSSMTPSEYRAEQLFPVLMLFRMTHHEKILKRPTQKQVDILSVELGREPKWFVDALELDL